MPDASAQEARQHEQLVGALLVVASAVAFGLIPWWLDVANNHGATTMGVLGARFWIATIGAA